MKHCYRKKNKPIAAIFFIIIVAMTSLVFGQDMLIMPVGNSITNGVIGSTDGVGFRNDLHQKLSNSGIAFDFVGSTGADPYEGFFFGGAVIENFLPGGSHDISNAMDTYQPNTILLHIGTNNVSNQTVTPYSYNNGGSFTSTASGKLAELLGYLLKWKNGPYGAHLKKIVLCKIIPKTGAESKVQEFNTELLAILVDSENETCPSIPPGSIMLIDQHSPFNTGTMMSQDGIHPNDFGYSQLANVYHSAVLSLTQSDGTAPGRVTNLRAGSIGITSAQVLWKAPGDDGTSGKATNYELRYSQFPLTGSNFVSEGILVEGVPAPLAPNSSESFTITGLFSGTRYYVALRTWDESNNASSLSNVVELETEEGGEKTNTFVDYFDRENIGPNWDAHPQFAIQNEELANTSYVAGWSYMAVYNAYHTPKEVSFTWSENASPEGVMSGGFAAMLDAPFSTANGYLIYKRNNDIYLRQILNGAAVTDVYVDKKRSTLGAGYPNPGDIILIKIKQSETENRFDFYINGHFDASVSDLQKLQGSADSLFSGVMLYGNTDNNIDVFSVTIGVGTPTFLNPYAGGNQAGPIGSRLPIPFTTQVLDDYGIGVPGVFVGYSVTNGVGYLSTDSLQFDGYIWQEAENGSLTPPMEQASDTQASGNQFIMTTDIDGNYNQGEAEYWIYVPERNSYKLWGRVLAPDGDHNSCYVTIDGGNETKWEFSTNSIWSWQSKSFLQFYLDKGFHGMTIRNREPGTKVDKFLLTIHSSYTPSGKGGTNQSYPNITDNNGLAYSYLTFGQESGLVQVQAEVPGLQGSPVLFPATALAEDPAALTLISGNYQSGIAGQPLDSSFVVEVKDIQDNPVYNAEVEFLVVAGGGTLSDLQPVKTDINGRASTILTLGYEDEHQVTASVVGYPETGSVTFYATSTAGVPNEIRQVSEDGQTGRVAQPLTQPAVVKVVDDSEQPIVNFPVHFAVTAGGGTLDGDTITEKDVNTDSEGIAQVVLTLGDTAGVDNNIITVTAFRGEVPLQGSPITFTASANQGPAEILTKVDGDGQSAPIGLPLDHPFVVKVTDAVGNGIAGYEVSFEAIEGGGNLDGETQKNLLTDDQGQAQVTLFIGPNEGVNNRVRVTAQDLTGSPLYFEAVALEGVASELVKVSGDSSSAKIGNVLLSPFVIKVTDPFGNPKENIEVTFNVVGGGGNLSGQTVQVKNTNAQGLAQTTLTLGFEAGNFNQIVEARSTGLNGSPAIFRATATPDVPAKLVKLDGGDNQSAKAGSFLPNPIIVKVTDQHDNPIANHLVNFQVTSLEGSFEEGARSLNRMTNEVGIAQVEWRIGTVVGAENIVRAMSSGPAGNLEDSPQTFHATVLPGDPKSMVSNWKEQTAEVNTTLPVPMQVQIVDEYGNAVPDFYVHFTVTQGGGSIGLATEVDVPTDENGIAGVYHTLGIEAGLRNNVVRASASSAGIPVVDFYASAIPANAHAVAAVPGSEGQSGRVGTELPIPFAAKITDVYGNVIANFTVRFEVIEGNGNLSGLQARNVTTNPDGVAQVRLTLGTVPGTDNNIVHAIAHIAGAPLVDSPRIFKASATAGVPDKMNIVSGDSSSGVVGNALTEHFVVQVVDVYNNPIPEHNVVFEVTAGSGTLDGDEETKTVQTNSLGEAKVRLTLGTNAGEFNNKVMASARNNSGSHLVGSPHTFVVSAKASDATALAAATIEHEGTVGHRLSEPIVVKATDRAGNAVSGHPITFHVTKGGGTVSENGDSIFVVQTNGNGEALVYWTLGEIAGENNNELIVSATMDGVNPLDGSPITFTASANPDLPDSSASTVVATGPVPADNESTSIVTVTVADSFGNRVPGRVISFTASGEFNTFNPPAQVSNSNGQAMTSLKSSRAELKTIYARDVLADIEIGRFQVQFNPLAPEKLDSYHGNNQIANVGTVLQESLAVKVQDRFGNGISGQPVTFSVYEGHGSIVNAQPTVTDDFGVASAHWVLGTKPGQQFAEATSAILPGQSVVFKATGAVAVPATLEKIAGDNQSGKVGTPLPEPLVVQVKDVLARPIWGVPVTFTAVVGEGTIEENQPDTTDSYGRAQAHLILGGNAGQNTVQVSVAGLAQITFQATGNAGEAARLNLVSGSGQEAKINTQIPSPLVVSTTDEDSNNVGGVLVVFEIEEGDGTLSADSVITDANGYALTVYNTGYTAGEHVIKASSEGLQGSPVYIPLTVLPGDPYKMALYAGNDQNGTRGRKLVYPVKVIVMDRYDNSTPSVSLTFAAVSGGGGVVESQPVITNANGVTSAYWILGPELGMNTLIAYKHGLSGSPVEFIATGVSNHYPLFVDLPEDPHISEGELLEFEVKANDDDDDPITFGALALPHSATFDSLNSHIFSWTPSYQQQGIHLAKFTNRDNRGGFGIDSVRIHVDNSNRCPSIISYSPSLDFIWLEKPETITFSVVVADADGDQLSVRFYLNSNLVSENPSFTLISSNYPSQSYTLRVEVSDGECTVNLNHSWSVVISSIELASFSAETVPFKGVRLDWKTTNERGNAGFNVLRSQDQDDGFEVINSELIPPSRDGDYSFIDLSANAGKVYFYKLEDLDVNGNRTEHEVIRVDVALPKKIALDQNYPNPFNPETHIRFQLPKAVHTTVRIYNIVGQQVAVLVDKVIEPGYHELVWQGVDKNNTPVGSGIYYYQISAGDFKAVKKMVLLR